MMVNAYINQRRVLMGLPRDLINRKDRRAEEAKARKEQRHGSR